MAEEGNRHRAVTGDNKVVDLLFFLDLVKIVPLRESMSMVFSLLIMTDA